MKKLLFSIISLLIIRESISQGTMKTSIDNLIILNENINNGQGVVEVLINKTKCSYILQKHGESRIITVTNANKEPIASAIKAVGKSEYYIIGQEYIEQTDKTGNSIQFLNPSLVEKIFASKKLIAVKKEYVFFSPDLARQNYFSFYRPSSASPTSSSVRREKTSFATAMCLNQMCFDTICECFKQTLCALGQCLDNFVEGEVGNCNEEVRQVQACGGYGGKVQVIKKSVVKTPNTN
jgi:hypothetical protein